MCPGIIPSLAPPDSPGVIIPGQFGPINRTPGRLLTNETAFTMSKVGIPSVMQTTTPSPLIESNASAASIIASAANGGGT